MYSELQYSESNKKAIFLLILHTIYYVTFFDMEFKCFREKLQSANDNYLFMKVRPPSVIAGRSFNEIEDKSHCKTRTPKERRKE